MDIARLKAGGADKDKGGMKSHLTKSLLGTSTVLDLSKLQLLCLQNEKVVENKWDNLCKTPTQCLVLGMSSTTIGAPCPPSPAFCNLGTLPLWPSESGGYSVTPPGQERRGLGVRVLDLSLTAYYLWDGGKITSQNILFSFFFSDFNWLIYF